MKSSMFTFWKSRCIVVGVGKLVHLSQGHLAEEEETSVLLRRREAVVGRLGAHVSEVNALKRGEEMERRY